MENIKTQENPKKRSLARRAGIAVCWFFIGMLILSYASKAVSEKLMARVSTGYAGSTVLDLSTEGTGQWVAGETQFYSTYYTRRIVTVYARPGETISVGDPLFAYDVSTIKGGKKVNDKTVRAAKRALEKAEKAASSAADPSYAERTLENARQALAYAEFTYAQTYALQNGGVVRSTFSGTVVQCDLAAGKASTAGTTGFAIAPDGVVFCISLSETEAENVAVGDAVTLYKDGRAEKEELAVYEIGLPDADGNVEILCAGEAGKNRIANTRQDFKIEKQSSRFRQTVPIAALRQGGVNEYYVLLLSEKETILGTQLIAKKEDVKLIAHDGRNAAIDGGLSERDRLITESTKELKDGDYVVLKDAD